MSSLLHIGCDNRVAIPTLKDVDTGEAIEDAVVSITIFNDAADEVAGVVWPVPLVHVGAGRYEATLKDLELSAGCSYRARVVAISAGYGDVTFIARLDASHHWASD